MNDAKPFSNVVCYIDDGQIIELVKKYTNIWDRTDPMFGIQKEAENSWLAIANALDCEVDECKSRWTIIRSRYAKECRDMRNNFLESKPHKISWPFYEQCSFLKAVIRPRRSRKSLLTGRNPISHFEEMYNTPLHLEDSPAAEVFDRNLSPSYLDVSIETSSSSPDSLPCNDSKRKRNSEVTDNINLSRDDIKQILSNFKHTDSAPDGISPEDWHCVLSIGLSLSKMKDTKKKMMLKAKLMNILAEEGQWSD